MTTIRASSSDTSMGSVSVGEPIAARSILTVGWLVRRSLLWVGIVVIGVAAACLLYGVASKAEYDAGQKTPSRQHPLKV